MRKILILLIGLMSITSLAYGGSSLEAFIHSEDGSLTLFETELYETGTIDRVEVNGVKGFVIFRIIDGEKKEPVLRIDDFSQARGRQLPPGQYCVIPELAPFVSERRVLRTETTMTKPVKAYLKIYILSQSEAQTEGL